jgi:hypothetical protein
MVDDEIPTEANEEHQQLVTFILEVVFGGERNYTDKRIVDYIGTRRAQQTESTHFATELVRTVDHPIANDQPTHHPVLRPITAVVAGAS